MQEASAVPAVDQRPVPSLGASSEMLGLLELMTQILRQFAGLADEDIDAGIQDALAAIGDDAGVDRSYLLLLDERGEYLHNTHEWCEVGIRSEIYNVRQVP